MLGITVLSLFGTRVCLRSLCPVSSCQLVGSQIMFWELMADFA